MCANALEALLRSTMSLTFLKCCLLNNIDLSIGSIFLSAVPVFSEPSAVVGLNKLRSRYNLIYINI